MKRFAKPNLIISKCIEFDHCRYNGSIIASDFVKKIDRFVHFIPICPEVEINLGIPRKALRLVKDRNEKRLIQPLSDLDVTEKMKAFAESYLAKKKQIHGVILKSRSPSCGIKDVKLYSAKKNAAPLKRTSGLFGEHVLKTIPSIVESEARLRNTFIQEHFLVTIFTLAEFEQVKKKQTISDLVSFHSKNKFLFMAYDQHQLRKMGRITANQKKQSIDKVFKNYETLLFSIFKKPPSHKSTINVLLHLFGFVSDELSKPEKKFFLDLIEKYKHKKISLNVITNVLKSWIIRFSEPYLSNQTFFTPFPEALFEKDLSVIADTQRYWK